jgi:hypothetical protein
MTIFFSCLLSTQCAALNEPIFAPDCEVSLGLCPLARIEETCSANQTPLTFLLFLSASIPRAKLEEIKLFVISSFW